jgi:hypothetical protein
MPSSLLSEAALLGPTEGRYWISVSSNGFDMEEMTISGKNHESITIEQK